MCGLLCRRHVKQTVLVDAESAVDLALRQLLSRQFPDDEGSDLMRSAIAVF